LNVMENVVTLKRRKRKGAVKLPFNQTN